MKYMKLVDERIIKKWESLDRLPNDREQIKSEKLYDILYHMSNNKKRIEKIEKISENIPFMIDDIEDIVFYNSNNLNHILFICVDKYYSFEVFKEKENKEQRINKAYEYVKKNVRNIYNQEFGKRWEGRFGKKARESFVELFNESVDTEEFHYDITEEEAFEKVLNYIYAPGLTYFMLLLQDDFVCEGSFLI